jgi:hypothetical protein
MTSSVTATMSSPKVVLITFLRPMVFSSTDNPVCISSLQSCLILVNIQTAPPDCFGNSLLVNSQRSSRIVVHAPVSRHMEIIRLLKRPDRVPGCWPHHTINRPGIETLILQSLLYFCDSPRVWGSGMGCSSVLRAVLNSIRHLLAPGWRNCETSSCQQCSAYQ